jgi:hypothetical protein
VCWRVEQVSGSRDVGAEVVYASMNVSMGVGRLEHEGVTTLAGESLGRRRLFVPTRCEDRCLQSALHLAMIEIMLFKLIGTCIC